MRKVVLAAAVLALAGTTVALANGGFKRIREVMTGFKEVPVVSTTGRGVFTATINRAETQIEYELRYTGLEGGTVQQAHIHFGPPNNTGGIAVWLCSNLASPPTPPGVQPCPESPGSIDGVITAADIVGPTGQGIGAGEFDELIAAIRAGLTYVNVHTMTFPQGEIRSQITHDGGHVGHR